MNEETDDTATDARFLTIDTFLQLFAMTRIESLCLIERIDKMGIVATANQALLVEILDLIDTALNVNRLIIGN